MVYLSLLAGSLLVLKKCFVLTSQNTKIFAQNFDSEFIFE